MASSSPGRSRGAWVPGREGLGNPRRWLVLVLVVDRYGPTSQLGRAGGQWWSPPEPPCGEPLDQLFRAARFLLLTPASGVRIPWDRTQEYYVHAHFTLIAIRPEMILGRAQENSSRRGYSLVTLAGA